MNGKEEFEKGVEGFKTKKRAQLKDKALESKKENMYGVTAIHRNRHKKAQLHNEMKEYRMKSC